MSIAALLQAAEYLERRERGNLVISCVRINTPLSSVMCVISRGQPLVSWPVVAVATHWLIPNSGLLLPPSFFCPHFFLIKKKLLIKFKNNYFINSLYKYVYK